MATATITEQYILNAMQQESLGKKFPIAFDDIWQSAGYTHKHHAVRFLQGNSALKKGKHYIVSPQRVQTPDGGRSSHLIRMSRKGYRFFLSKSNTEQGNANLWFLLEVEDLYREHLERQLTATTQPKNESIKIQELKNTVKQQQKEIKRLAGIVETSRKLQFKNHFQNSFIWHCISHLESIQNDNDLCDSNNLRITPQMIYTMSSKIQESMTTSDNLNKVLEIDGYSGDYGIEMFKTFLEVEKFRNQD